MNIFILIFGKLISSVSKILNLGNGSTWPGHMALKLNKNFIKQTIGSKTKVILVAGTNGKTTTSALISHIFEQSGFSIVQNKSGANLLNGAASAIIQGIKPFSLKIDQDYLILEVDENNLPLVINQTNASYIIALDLFRDQLDRYGEIDSIIKKWRDVFEKLSNNTTLILNADDPQVSYLGKNLKSKVMYFGLNENDQEIIEHGADSIYCPKCQHILDYRSITFSHLGDWFCSNCGEKRPNLNLSKFGPYPIPGTYNKYNTLAAILLATDQKISKKLITDALKSFKPAFGRQEEFDVNGKKVKMFLSKNPTSFNESLSTISDLKAKNLLVILNDRTPDGLDISWIWDTNTSLLENIPNIIISGDRAYDMALRIKYSELQKFQIFEHLSNAIEQSLEKTKSGETLFILPTYSAMLETRKILTGREIL
ncbi:MAG: Mur ligase family protein [Patescibacteria group bacterium]|nr:Mur ligase family protein [Patescibacteria group bacterium]